MRRIRSRSWLISSSRGGELVFGPVLQVGGGPDSFPVGEQLLQVGLEFGQVGRVAAEMAAAQAGELVGACLAAGFDVGRLGADPERHGDLPDPHPGVLIGQQAADLEHDPAALAVELVGADPVHRSPDPLLSNAIVLECGLDLVVSEQVTEHVRAMFLMEAPLWH